LIFNLVYYIALFSSAIPLLLNGKPPLRSKHTLYRYVTILTLVKFFSDLLVYVLQIKIQNSLPAFHISVLLEFVFILQILNGIHCNKHLKIQLFIGCIACWPSVGGLGLAQASVEGLIHSARITILTGTK
jgi:hypothetical protein